jgi:hypothetical protein
MSIQELTMAGWSFDRGVELKTRHTNLLHQRRMFGDQPRPTQPIVDGKLSGVGIIAHDRC